MKIGDLVQLSAYGQARNHNHGWYGGWGLILEIHDDSTYPIKAQWYDTRSGEDQGGARFHPRELKKYKPDKK